MIYSKRIQESIPKAFEFLEKKGISYRFISARGIPTLEATVVNVATKMALGFPEDKILK